MSRQNPVFSKRGSSDRVLDSGIDSRFANSPSASLQKSDFQASQSRENARSSPGSPLVTSQSQGLSDSRSLTRGVGSPRPFVPPLPQVLTTPSTSSNDSFLPENRSSSVGRRMSGQPSDPQNLVSLSSKSGQRFNSSNYYGKLVLRSEYQTATKIVSIITMVVDPIYYKLEAAYGTAVALIINRYAAAAVAVCFLPAMAVAVPVGLFCITLGLPLFIPFVFFCSFLALVNGFILAALLAVSPPARRAIQARLEPSYNSFSSSDLGRRLLYDGGPRPSPVELVVAAAPRSPAGKLAVCLLLDAIGSMTYMLPLLGEGADLVWAPLQAAAMSAMFERECPAAKWVGLAEELLPMTDALPSATLTWMHCHSDLLGKAQLLQGPAR